MWQMFWYIWKYPNIDGNHNYHLVVLRYASCIDTVLGLQTTCTGRHGNIHGASCSMLHVVCDRRCMCRRCLHVHTSSGHVKHAKRWIFVLLSSVCKGLDNDTSRILWACKILTARRLYKLSKYICELAQLESRMVRLNSEVGLLCFHRWTARGGGGGGGVSWKYALCPQIFTNSAVHSGISDLAQYAMLSVKLFQVSRDRDPNAFSFVMCEHGEVFIFLFFLCS